MNRPANKIPVSYPAGVVLAVCAALLLTLFGSLRFYQSLQRRNNAGRDTYRIGAMVEQLREVARILPPDVVVGYVSDVPHKDPRGSAAFFGTQYALAPRLLVEAHAVTAPEWIVGNFAAVFDYQAFAESRGWTLARDFGGGLVLFRRKTR